MGVGCQKGGTTWLHHYLAGSRQYAPGYRKEYHVFDSADLGTEQRTRKKILRMAAKELEKARRGEQCDAEQLHRASLYADDQFYFDYFAGLLRSNSHFRMTADITPAYAMLGRDRVAGVKESFARRGIRTVSIFLMRDPVERIWSHIRMQDTRQPKLFDASAEEMVARLYTEPAYNLRTRYDHTLQVLDSVFDPGEVWYGFYEELFREDRIREICRLVNIDFRPPDFDSRRNASPKVAPTLPDQVVREVASYYRDVYLAVASRFPATDLERIWPSSKYVL